MLTLLKYAKNAAKCEICGNRIFAYFWHAYIVMILIVHKNRKNRSYIAWYSPRGHLKPLATPRTVSSTDLSTSPLRPHLWCTGIITLALCPGTYWVQNRGPVLQGSEWTGTTLSRSAHPRRRSARWHSLRSASSNRLHIPPVRLPRSAPEHSPLPDLASGIIYRSTSHLLELYIHSVTGWRCTCFSDRILNIYFFSSRRNFTVTLEDITIL